MRAAAAQETRTMRTKTPTLAWLLTALTCFLAGMAVVEGRHQTVALPVLPPVGVVVTVAVAFEPTPEPTPSPTPPSVPFPTPPSMPSPTPSRPGMGDGSGGTGNVR
jgi:hypothetical protein